MPSFLIQPIEDRHRELIARLLAHSWGSPTIVSRGVAYQADRLPGFVATQQGSLVGMATYHISGEECELVSLDSLVEGIGIGSALIQAVRQVASHVGCRRLWLITTNDNLPALRFYQMHAFHLVAVYPNSLEYSRQLKPEIPSLGLDGIPLRDEIELEIIL